MCMHAPFGGLNLVIILTELNIHVPDDVCSMKAEMDPSRGLEHAPMQEKSDF